MKQKLYFEQGAEICLTKAEIIDSMKWQGLTEVEVFEAEKEHVPGFRWCRHASIMIELGACDRFCNGYSPNNGRFGRCRHLGNNFYRPTDKKLTIVLK